MLCNHLQRAAQSLVDLVSYILKFELKQQLFVVFVARKQQLRARQLFTAFLGGQGDIEPIPVQRRLNVVRVQELNDRVKENL